jgi:hypothetical protein
MHIADKQITRNGIVVTSVNGISIYYDAIDALELSSWLHAKSPILLRMLASALNDNDIDVHQEKARVMRLDTQNDTHQPPTHPAPPLPVEEETAQHTHDD